MIYDDLFTTYGGIPPTFHISSSFSHQNCAALPQSVGSSDGHMERSFSLRGNGWLNNARGKSWMLTPDQFYMVGPP